MNYSNLLVSHPKVKGLPGLERLNEDVNQRRAREREIRHMLKIRGMSSIDHSTGGLFDSDFYLFIRLHENGRWRQLGR